jgi:hypothetical protein
MDDAMRRELIGRYKDGPSVVMDALTGITDTALDRRPGTGDWTPREVVHHLADSEMISAIRLRRLIVEDNPTIDAYDEGAFALRLTLDRPVDASLDAMCAARRTSAELLDRLAESDWSRAGTHTESGRYSVEDWLLLYAAHAHDHAEQIRRARTGDGSTDARGSRSGD